jgi:hypothetical protein
MTRLCLETGTCQQYKARHSPCTPCVRVARRSHQPLQLHDCCLELSSPLAAVLSVGGVTFAVERCLLCLATQVCYGCVRLYMEWACACLHGDLTGFQIGQARLIPLFRHASQATLLVPGAFGG